MDVAVIGAGAIGSALAAQLSPTTPVTLIGHENPHLEMLRAEPLSIIDSAGSRWDQSVSVTTNHGAVTGSDLVVLAVKSYDTNQTLADLDPFLEDQPVLTLQNGLGNIEQIRETAGSSRVIGGTTTMGAFVPEPGTVQLTNIGKTRLGYPWRSPDEYLDSVVETFQTAGLETDVTDSVRQAIWEKVLINVGINPVTALAGVPNGALREGPGRTLMRSAIGEANQVAAAEGQAVETPVEKALTVVHAASQNRSSMLRDLENGSQTEIDALNGEIVERGDLHGIDVPVNRTLTLAIKLASSAGSTE